MLEIPVIREIAARVVVVVLVGLRPILFGTVVIVVILLVDVVLVDLVVQTIRQWAQMGMRAHREILGRQPLVFLKIFREDLVELAEMVGRLARVEIKEISATSEHFIVSARLVARQLQGWEEVEALPAAELAQLAEILAPMAVAEEAEPEILGPEELLLARQVV